MWVRLFFIVTAVLEGGAGACLLILPEISLAILLGLPRPALETVLVTRIAGVALLALGVACAPARKEKPGMPPPGLLLAMLLYNGSVAALLAYGGWALDMAGVLLWPAVVLHGIMAVWNAVCFTCRGQ
jgi:hypothetical protein